MQQSPGFVDSSSPAYVYKLNCFLYGLKKVLRAWYEKLFHTLLGLGFVSSAFDPSMFVKASSSLTVVLVYVDDIIVTDSSASDYCALISHIDKLFHVNDLGPLNYVFGIGSSPFCYFSASFSDQIHL